MASKTMLLLDELWATIEKNQQRLVEFCASLGLPPPPPLAARPPLKAFVPPPKPFPPKPLLHQIKSSASKKRSHRHHKTTPKTAPKRTYSTAPTAPKPTSNGTHRHPKQAPKTAHSPTQHATHKTRVSPLNIIEPNATVRRDWRPPWHQSSCYVTTKPNAAGRYEWRPPWTCIPSLRTRTFFRVGVLIRSDPGVQPDP
ncbi:hypothetical protein HanRHA438_Chr10g0461201 [Helianthus annuus]|nr:hypothetical protein HanRHA438_Chr10g0461201 [Helianthus annuus]